MFLIMTTIISIVVIIVIVTLIIIATIIIIIIVAIIIVTIIVVISSSTTRSITLLRVGWSYVQSCLYDSLHSFSTERSFIVLTFLHVVFIKNQRWLNAARKYSILYKVFIPLQWCLSNQLAQYFIITHIIEGWDWRFNHWSKWKSVPLLTNNTRDQLTRSLLICTS